MMIHTVVIILRTLSGARDLGLVNKAKQGIGREGLSSSNARIDFQRLIASLYTVRKNRRLSQLCTPQFRRYNLYKQGIRRGSVVVIDG